MKCRSCGAETVVIDTRPGDTEEGRVSYLVRRARRAFGRRWQDGAFRVRKHVCEACGRSELTVEVWFDDLEQLVGELPRDASGLLCEQVPSPAQDRSRACGATS